MEGDEAEEDERIEYLRVMVSNLWDLNRRNKWRESLGGLRGTYYSNIWHGLKK